MISAWWLALAFVVGVAVGVFLTAIMAAGGQRNE